MKAGHVRALGGRDRQGIHRALARRAAARGAHRHGRAGVPGNLPDRLRQAPGHAGLRRWRHHGQGRRKYALDTPEDFFLRGMANIAYAAGKPVPEASDDDMALTGVDRRRAAAGQAQAGRVAPGGDADDRRALRHAGRLDRGRADAPRPGPSRCRSGRGAGGFRHAMTGERYSGCPTWYPARLADGRDVRAGISARRTGPSCSAPSSPT